MCNRAVPAELCRYVLVTMLFSTHTHTHSPHLFIIPVCHTPTPDSNIQIIHQSTLLNFNPLHSEVCFFLPFSASISINCARLHRCLTHDDDTQFRSFFFSLQDYISWNTTLHALHSSLGGETLYDIQACYR